MKKILKTILKNILVFFAGAASGIIICAFLFIKPLLEAAAKKQDVGLGIIALAPVLFIIYTVVFGGAGGMLAVIIYNFVKYLKLKFSK